MDIRNHDWHGVGARQAALRTATMDGPDDEGLNDRAVIGNNRPPPDVPTSDSPLGFAKTALTLMEEFMNDTPVIETGEQAAKAKTQIETARGALAEMEAERDKKVRPLNDRVAEINGVYGAVSKPFKRVLDEVKSRLTAWAKAEEDKREKAAREARRIADELVAKAREAERVEREARDNAAAGELDVNVAEKITQADDAFREAKVAVRQSAVAERDSTVRVGGGPKGSRALGMRTVTTLTLDDPLKAIVAMGVSEKTRESILSDARAFKKLKGQWPSGVTAVESREI